VELAIRCYRLQGDAGMVLALQKVAGVEDKNLLAGHIAVLLESVRNHPQSFCFAGEVVHEVDRRLLRACFDYAHAALHTAHGVVLYER
jgi:WD repeat-containing protein 19